VAVSGCGCACVRLRVCARVCVYVYVYVFVWVCLCSVPLSAGNLSRTNEMGKDSHWKGQSISSYSQQVPGQLGSVVEVHTKKGSESVECSR